jgi:hypothetical protein
VCERERERDREREREREMNHMQGKIKQQKDLQSTIYIETQVRSHLTKICQFQQKVE